MREYVKETIKGIVAGLVLLTLLLYLFLVSGCKLIHEATKDKTDKKSDSVGVRKNDTYLNKGDTTKTEKTNTKETVYYPQPIYIQGKDGKTEVVFVPQSTKETGTEKVNNGLFDQWRQHYEDSTRQAQREKETNKTSETTAKTDWLTIGMLIAIGLMFLKSFSPPAIKFLHNLITKTSKQ